MDTVNKPAPEKAAVTLLRLPLTVPAGHVMPGGEAIRDPFNLTVEVGIRWHPEWEAPRVTANAYRFMYHGDAMCWSGDKLAACFGFLMPADLMGLCLYHGEFAEQEGERGHRLKFLLDALGLTPPPLPQPISTFIARPMTETTH